MKRFKGLVVVLGLVLAVPAGAHASTTYEAPYSGMTAHGSCLSWSQVFPGPTCHATNNVDAESGRVLIAASLPEGATSPMQGSSSMAGLEPSRGLDPVQDRGARELGAREHRRDGSRRR